MSLINQANVAQNDERLEFNQCIQEAGESFDAYLTALRNVTETCNFCTRQAMSDSLTQDHIVIRIRSEDARKPSTAGTQT